MPKKLTNTTPSFLETAKASSALQSEEDSDAKSFYHYCGEKKRVNEAEIVIDFDLASNITEALGLLEELKGFFIKTWMRYRDDEVHECRVKVERVNDLDCSIPIVNAVADSGWHRGNDWADCYRMAINHVILRVVGYSEEEIVRTRWST